MSRPYKRGRVYVVTEAEVERYLRGAAKYVREAFAAERDATLADFQIGAVWDKERQKIRTRWEKALSRAGKSRLQYYTALSCDDYLQRLRQTLLDQQEERKV